MQVVTLRTGDKYGPEYATRLCNGLRRNTTRAFDFVCVTESKFPGWWGKLELFPPEERTVFLDLDLVITGNVDFLFDYSGPFCAWKDPWSNGLNSSVMSIDAGFGASVLDEFSINAESYIRKFHGDQEFLRTMTKPDYWPAGLVQSYKADKRKQGPGNARIVVFHGEPKPHQLLNVPWVKDAWV